MRYLLRLTNAVNRGMLTVAVFLSASIVCTGLPGPAAADLSTAAERGGEPDASWRHSPIWDDGNAEFSAYEVTWAHYRSQYKGSALLILVKEPWAPDLNVKADHPRTGGFDVLKCNHVRDVPTGIYTYHQMASIYLRRDSAQLVKIATTSSEACGISTSTMLGGQLETHSYFDGQGDQEHRYPAQAFPRDALPALLRDYVKGSPPAEMDVFPTLMTGRFGEFTAESFKVSRKNLGEVHVPAGTYEGVQIELQGAGKSSTYVFDAAPPHVLLRIKFSDGTEYRLAKSERIPYWSIHMHGGESWYPEPLQ